MVVGLNPARLQIITHCKLDANSIKSLFFCHELKKTLFRYFVHKKIGKQMTGAIKEKTMVMSEKSLLGVKSTYSSTY